MTLDLEIFSPGTAPRSITLPPPRATLGRAASCTVVLEHESVSLEHAELRIQDGRWQLYQRSGRSTTRVDDKTVAGDPVGLRDHGVLRLGDVTIEYHQLPKREGAQDRSLNETVRAPVTVHTTAVPKEALARMEPIHGPPASVSDMPTMILPPRTAGVGGAESGGRAPRAPIPGQGTSPPDAGPSTWMNPQRRPAASSPVHLPAPIPWQPEPAPATQARIPRVATPAPPPVPASGEPVRRPGSEPETLVNPLRGRAAPISSPERRPPAAGIPQGPAAATVINVPQATPNESTAGTAHPRGAFAAMVDPANRSDPLRPRPANPESLAGRANESPNPSSERKYLELQVNQLAAEVSRLRKENESLTAAKATLEAQLGRRSTDARSPSKTDLAAHGRTLLDPFAASLREAAELLENHEPERARRVLREASFQLADLHDLFAESL